jgi:AcrR family transcriptional regulator
MATSADPDAELPDARPPLRRERVLAAAVVLADASGIEALTMRRLAQALGVEAMSLYHHVENKDDILEGIVDLVVSEFELPSPGAGWKTALRLTAVSAHTILVRHRWAARQMLASDGWGSGRLRYMEGVLGTLRRAGFSPEMTDHAYHALDSHILGFTMWEVGITAVPGTLTDLATDFLRRLPPGQFPYLIEHIEQHLRPSPPGDKGEFEFGLDLILDGLERLRDEA